MRIIGGQHRGTKLADLVGDKTRPTADRIRESLFNILQGGRFGHILNGATVIDLFAGTGALGLEALSQGAAHASFVENDAAALNVIRTNIAKINRQDDSVVIAGNATTLGRWHNPPADLVFADAPYGSGDGLLAIDNLARIGAMRPGSLIVIETGKNETLDNELLVSSTLALLDTRRYGKAQLLFLQFAP